MQQLKHRLAQMEDEIRQLKETSRVNSIEYHIQNLNVESISNGILDLGVHMGNEMDKRIQTHGETASAPGARAAVTGSPPDQVELTDMRLEQLEQLEESMTEVKEQVAASVERLSHLEERYREWEQRLQHLEAMHP